MDIAIYMFLWPAIALITIGFIIARYVRHRIRYRIRYRDIDDRTNLELTKKIN